jgi:hypothetical protein
MNRQDLSSHGGIPALDFTERSGERRGACRPHHLSGQADDCGEGE